MDILALSALWKTVAVFWVIAAIILILIILIQKGKGAGLGGAFGAGAPGGGLLGTKTGDFFTWVTIIIAAIVLFLPVILGVMAVNQKNADMAPQAPAIQQSSPAQETKTIPAETPTESDGQTAVQMTEDAAEEAAKTTKELVEKAENAIKEAVDAGSKIETTEPDINK